MNIKETTTKVLKVSELRPNEGQIAGVPSNPRQISRSEFEGLCNSLREDNLTGVLQLKVYNHGGEWVVLDGNMRLKALQTIGIDDVQCLIVPEGTDEKTLRKIVISANSTFGEWDMNMLANEWNAEELSEWGIDVPQQKANDDTDLSDTVNQEYIVEVSCACEQEQEQLYNELIQQGYQCRILTL